MRGSSSVTPTSNAPESSPEENGPRINFTVLSPDVANRISEPTTPLGMHHQPVNQLQEMQAQPQFNGPEMVNNSLGHIPMAPISNAADLEQYDFR